MNTRFVVNNTVAEALAEALRLKEQALTAYESYIIYGSSVNSAVYSRAISRLRDFCKENFLSAERLLPSDEELNAVELDWAEYQFCHQNNWDS